MSDVAAQEALWNPRVSVADPEAWFACGDAASAATRARFGMPVELRYGDGPLMTVDVFAASTAGATRATPGPVHVFLHGGFWRSRDKRDYSFVADHLVPAGITVVIANYDLCPAVTVSTIVDQTSALLRWIRGGGLQPVTGCPHPGRLTASGHSAGAQLIAMAACRDPALLQGPQPLAQALLISGIYALTPLLAVSVNTLLRLDAESALACSPLHYPAPAGLIADVVVGGDEPDVWWEQTAAYGRHLGDGARQIRRLPGLHHFSIIDTLRDRDSWLTQRLITTAISES